MPAVIATFAIMARRKRRHCEKVRWWRFLRLTDGSDGGTLRAMNQSDVMTMREYATRRGVSVRTLHHWALKGYSLDDGYEFVRVNPKGCRKARYSIRKTIEPAAEA